MTTRLTVTKTIRIDADLYREIDHAIKTHGTNFTDFAVSAFHQKLAHCEGRAAESSQSPYGLSDHEKQMIFEKLSAELKERIDQISNPRHP